MTLPTRDTTVTYPAGETSGASTIAHIEERGDGSVAVILDTTCAHPVDPSWPDQGADRGTLTIGGEARELRDVLVGAIHEGMLYLGNEVPVRTGTEGWVFVVAHVIDGPAPELGAEALVEVDAAYRFSLSAAHTACHLAALALDEALAEFWTKSAPLDALGSPAFDRLAIQSSRIAPLVSEDTYRLGKSLRKKGLPASAFDDPDTIAEHVNERLAQWLASGAGVRIEADGGDLSGRRHWVCDLPEGDVSLPCGGTHVTSLSQLSAAVVDFGVSGEGNTREVLMTTRVTVVE
ncbi:metal-dependent hydrolase [Bowdeniella nasicola]|nr:metal-dependent hydrolase [Bowdeniella nasicola]